MVQQQPLARPCTGTRTSPEENAGPRLARLARRTPSTPASPSLARCAAAGASATSHPPHPPHTPHLPTLGVWESWVCAYSTIVPRCTPPLAQQRGAWTRPGISSRSNVFLAIRFSLPPSSSSLGSPLFYLCFCVSVSRIVWFAPSQLLRHLPSTAIPLEYLRCFTSPRSPPSLLAWGQLSFHTHPSFHLPTWDPLPIFPIEQTFNWLWTSVSSFFRTAHHFRLPK